LLDQDKNKKIIEIPKDWRDAILPEISTLGDVIHNLNKVGIKIVLIVDNLKKFLGTISDGDIRRGLLKGLNFSSPISSIIQKNSFVALPETPKEIVKQLMLANKIQQIPIVDKSQHVVGLHFWDEIITQSLRPNIMVIMAGGKGARLFPYTENCPKPMVLVAGKPILQHIIERGKSDGFNHFFLAIYHLGHMIENFFENGEKLGVKIDYLREKTPLGTAGALSLLNPKEDEPFIVTNGDLISDVSYGGLLDFHNRHNANATMAVRIHEWQNPFGVVQIKGEQIVGFEEKPITLNYINAGVYAFSPHVIRHLNKDEACDIPTLFERLLNHGLKTIAYPMHEPWLDVGRPDDLIRAENNQSKRNIKNGG
jgi:dTDP-glucose pyrophosphorylase